MSAPAPLAPPPAAESVHTVLIRNTAWYGAVTMVSLASGLIMSVILARGLGPARMGQLSYVVWAERTMIALATLGWALATVRYTAESWGRGDAAGAWSFVTLFRRRQILTTLIVGAALAPLILAAAPRNVEWPLMVVVIGLLPITIESIYTCALQGARRYDLTAGTSTLKMSLQLIVAVAGIAAGVDLVVLFCGFLLTLVISCLRQRAQAHRVYREGLHAAPAVMTADVRAYFVPLSIVVVLESIVWDRSEVFFLGIHATTEQIAFYTLASGLSMRAMIVPEIAVGALLPAFSTLFGSGAPAEFARLYRTALRWVGLIGAAVAAVVAALAPVILATLYGDAYLPAAPYVGALAGIGVLSTLRKVAWAALRAAGDRRCALTAAGVAALINVGLAAVLVPRYAVVGAVVAGAAGQITASVWVFIGMARTHGIRFPGADVARALGAALVAWLVTWVLAGGPHDVGRALAGAGAGLVTFVLAAIALGLIGAREWSLVITSTRRLLAARATG